MYCAPQCCRFGRNIANVTLKSTFFDKQNYVFIGCKYLKGVAFNFE